jgi:pimeloyl-ACP methyl ester carboxylesterase
LGGAPARDAAERFWTKPDAASYAVYKSICKPLYSAVARSNSDAAARASVDKDILFAWAGGEQQTMNLLPGLARAQCPVLVLAGAQHPVCTLADAHDIVTALPAHLVQFEQFDDCGHGVWRDAPEAAFSRLRRFISG